MFPDEARNRQRLLKDIILELSEKLLENDEMILQYIKRLKKIYDDGFRHKYSDFFPIILDIWKDSNSYVKEYLLDNLESIDIYLENMVSQGNDEYDNLYEKFHKLVDHLNLQIAQLTYSHVSESRSEQLKSQLEELRPQLEESRLQLDKSNKAIKKAKEGIKKVNNEARQMQGQMVSVLGIFSTVVLGFSGGLSFLSSSITSISEAQYPESIVLAMIICGIIIFNVLSYMLYIISRIIDKNILSGCKAEYCSKCDNHNKCFWFKRLRKRFPFLYYFNVLAVLGIIADIIIWFLDIKGII